MNNQAKTFIPFVLVSAGVILAAVVLHGEAWDGFLLEVFTLSFFFLFLGMGSLGFLSIHYLSGTVWWQSGYSIISSLSHIFFPVWIIINLIIVNLSKQYFMESAHLSEIQNYMNHNSLTLFGQFLLFSLLIMISELTLAAIRRSFLNATSQFISKARKWSKIYVVFYTISVIILTIYWIIPVYDGFNSTLFPFFILSGSLQTAVAAIIIAGIIWKSLGKEIFISPAVLINEGKYLFAFSLIWAYLWYAQYMLIWYANLPEEAALFIFQLTHFKILFYLVLLLNFTLPFTFLLLPSAKKNNWLMFISAFSVISGQVLNLYLYFLPASSSRVMFPTITGIITFLIFLSVLIIRHISSVKDYNSSCSVLLFTQEDKIVPKV